MRKADKLFQLTNLIRARQPITAEEIANELNVSIRTVYRYIDDLSVTGIPIYGTTGIGYQMDEKFELPPLTLNESELDALLLGVKMIKGWTGEQLAQSASKLFHKIEAVLPRNLLLKNKDVVFAPDFMHSAQQREIWDKIHNATKELRIISIDYLSLDNHKTSRTLYPLGLVYWGGKWTLGAWCTTKKDYRNFRIDRIESIEIKKQNYIQNETICLKAFMASNKK